MYMISKGSYYYLLLKVYNVHRISFLDHIVYFLYVELKCSLTVGGVG